MSRKRGNKKEYFSRNNINQIYLFFPCTFSLDGLVKSRK